MPPPFWSNNRFIKQANNRYQTKGVCRSVCFWQTLVDTYGKCLKKAFVIQKTHEINALSVNN